MKSLIRIVLVLGILNFALCYFAAAQICSIRGSQTGNLGSGGYGYSKTFRDNITGKNMYAISNNRIASLGGVTMENQKLEYFQINSNSLPGQNVTSSRPDSTSLNWKISQDNKIPVKKEQ